MKGGKHKAQGKRPGILSGNKTTTGEAAMPITFRCATCGRTVEVPSGLLGRPGRCRGCGHVQRIVGPETTPAEPSVYEVEAPVVEPPKVETESHRRRSRGPDLRALFRASAAEPSRVQGLAACLVALSAADLFMTFTLLRASPAFFEANPVARWFFARWNMVGMVAFKFSIIAGVIALAELIERRRPGRGKFVLIIGCIGAAYAVIVGLRLFLGHAGPAAGAD
jgi:hypothetical protein